MFLHGRQIRVLWFVDGSVVLCWRLPGFPIGAPEFYIFGAIILGRYKDFKEFSESIALNLRLSAFICG